MLGQTLEAAKRGAARVKAEYRALTPILTIPDAITANSFHSPPARIRRGEASVAIAESPHRLSGELSIGGQEHFYLETQCALAESTKPAVFIMDSSTQHPSETQIMWRVCWALSRNQVSVQCLRMGGAFGGKEVQANPWAAIAALGAWKTRRPVCVRLPRQSRHGPDGQTPSVSSRGFPPASTTTADCAALSLRSTPMPDGAWIFPNR